MGPFRRGSVRPAIRSRARQRDATNQGTHSGVGPRRRSLPDSHYNRWRWLHANWKHDRHRAGKAHGCCVDRLDQYLNSTSEGSAKYGPSSSACLAAWGIPHNGNYSKGYKQLDAISTDTLNL